MPTERLCPGCRKPLPPDVPLGLCPECLVRAGFSTGTESGAGAAGFVPPPVEDIAKLFPQFEIIELIGRGGMGAVYQARQPALQRFVALKLLRPDVANDPGFAERFLREARALARLNHPHIVAVHDFGQAGGLPYLVMEFVEGANLRTVQRAGRMAPEKALQIVPQICDALQYAHHEGVVHRDIKPENILLDTKGRVKIADFGIAKIVGAPPEKLGLTGGKDIVGTPHYMAPEQVERPQTVDHRADIFSLGVVFYELLTGELPLGRFAPPSRKVQVDVRLDDVVLRALEKEPERRYQTASQIKADVETIVSTAAAEPLKPGQLAPRGPAKKTAAVALAIGGVLVAVLAGWFIISLPGHDRSRPGVSGKADERLRYQWRQGESHVYSVKVEATADDYVETVTGNIIYTVRAVEGDRATLSYRSHLGPPLRHARPGKMLPASIPFGFGNFWAGSPFAGSDREIQVDATGKILSQTGRNQALPQALGDLERLVFEPLSPQGRNAWETENDCTILLDSVMPFPPASPFGRPEQTTLSAREKASYQAGPVSGTTLPIHKTYELKTQETVGGLPRVQLSGEGTIRFDTAVGLPRSMEFQGALTESTDHLTQRTPLTLSYQLLEAGEKETALKPTEAARTEPQELTAAEFRETLADLKSPNEVRRSIAISRLGDVKPTEARDDVVKELIAALDDANWATRQSAARALGVWGTAPAVAPLIRTLQDREFSVRWAAIDALAQLKSPEAAAPLARLLVNGSDALQVVKALEALGPAAEEPVIAVLTGKDRETRRHACRILREIGTAKSIPALTAAASDADSITAMLAKDALKAIDFRSPSGHPPAAAETPQPITNTVQP